MNDDDWATLKLIDALKTLDLSKAETKSIPERQFDGNNGICPYLTTVKLPNTIENVGSGAFYSKSNLTTINWPTSAEKIPNGCFYGCYNLQPFTIPANVTDIEDVAFHGCNSFKPNIPSAINYIGNQAFKGCNMEDIDVVIPEGTTIGSRVFENTRVKSITFPSTYYRFHESGLGNPTVTLTFKSPTVMLSGYVASEGTSVFPSIL